MALSCMVSLFLVLSAPSAVVEATRTVDEGSGMVHLAINSSGMGTRVGLHTSRLWDTLAPVAPLIPQIEWSPTCQEHVVVPAFVRSISHEAFKSCLDLKTVTFEDGSMLTSIGDRAFYWCTNLKEVTFGKASHLASIGEQAFHSTALEEIDFPKSMQSIGTDAFYGCTNLKKVRFEDGSMLTSIGEQAFAKTGLQESDIPTIATLQATIVLSKLKNVTEIRIADRNWTDPVVCPNGKSYERKNVEHVAVCFSNWNLKKEDLQCPITLDEFMQDPVICRDGYSYEKEAISIVFNSQKGEATLSPMTRENIGTSVEECYPNEILRDMIQAKRSTTTTTGFNVPT